MNILSAHNISKKYHHPQDEIQVLSNVFLEIPQGCSMAITGESGRGKTTLLYLLSGLDLPDSGKIFVNNQNILELSDNELSKLRAHNFGFIFQHHFLLNDLNALENVLLPLRIIKTLNKNTIDQALYLFSELHMEHRKYHMPEELSGGEKQRIAVIRALVHNPKIIFADEPTGSLDKENAQNLEELLFKMVYQQQTTLILSTHNPDFASRCKIIKSINKLEKE